MADNISELPKASPGEIKSSGKWAFLRKIMRRKPANVQLLQAESPQAAEDPEMPQKVVQIPQNSGLEKLLKIWESGSEGIMAHRITRLYPDFLKYFNEVLANKYSKDPKTLAKIMEKLNAGDYEVIEMFARVMEAKYNTDITERRRAPIESRKGISSTAESAIEPLGFKKAEARVLAFEMKNKIAQTEKRQSRAEFASGLRDWKIILSDPKHQVDWNEELAKIRVAFPGESANLSVPPPSQK